MTELRRRGGGGGGGGVWLYSLKMDGWQKRYGGCMISYLGLCMGLSCLTTKSPYLGILSWLDKDLHLLLNTLVMDKKPDQVEGHTPCIVAHMIFMCLRYPDHCHKKEMTTTLIQEVIKGIKKVTKVSINGYWWRWG